MSADLKALPPPPDRGVLKAFDDAQGWGADEVVILVMKGNQLYRVFHSDFDTVRLLGAAEMLKLAACGLLN